MAEEMKKGKMSAEESFSEVESEMKERGQKIEQGRIKEKEMSQRTGMSKTKGAQTSK